MLKQNLKCGIMSLYLASYKTKIVITGKWLTRLYHIVCVSYGLCDCHEKKDIYTFYGNLFKRMFKSIRVRQLMYYEISYSRNQDNTCFTLCHWFSRRTSSSREKMVRHLFGDFHQGCVFFQPFNGVQCTAVALIALFMFMQYMPNLSNITSNAQHC